jgi:hypothetical protein
LSKNSCYDETNFSFLSQFHHAKIPAFLCMLRLAILQNQRIFNALFRSCAMMFYTPLPIRS